ncbi:ORF6C domain-containing protein [Roseospira visakhapatnamensis]|uniref:Uncharacterized protein n=1 Tax=Roseospira visakhapatnamensis TaxID=390880 RepID=A0A7W6RCH3_9PROT|nr:ORF6C domain-containing protein [Roseospira visakhapatnamensis]MBB4265408.1 hypothetical protein [Roseospira visakhapatnamensis]
MNDSAEDRKQRLRQIIGGDEKRSHSKSSGHTITGNNNIVGNGNSINLHEPKIVRKVYVQTGVGTIDAAQKKQINEMFAEWARVRDLVRKTSPEYKALRSAFNRYMGVNSYHEIKQDDFDKAVTWLQRQTGIVLSMSSAKTRVPDWRKKRYASINARAKEFPGGAERYRLFAKERFGTTSLKELTDEQLDAVYHHVFGWRRQ